MKVTVNILSNLKKLPKEKFRKDNSGAMAGIPCPFGFDWKKGGFVPVKNTQKIEWKIVGFTRRPPYKRNWEDDIQESEVGVCAIMFQRIDKKKYWYHFPYYKGETK